MRYYLILALILLMAVCQSFAEKKEIAYTWKFYGQKLTLLLHYDSKVYQSYISDRPSQKLDKESYYQHFLIKKDGDKYVEKIAEDLKYFAELNKFSANKLAELAITFVQALPYNNDECKSGVIAICDYPYVTLTRGSGTCLDKAILGVALLKELGFATTMIYFDKIEIVPGRFDQHVVIGLETKSPLAFFNKYCYVEVDTYATIGRVSRVMSSGFLIDDRQAADIRQNKKNAERLGQFSLYLGSPGKKYIF